MVKKPIIPMTFKVDWFAFTVNESLDKDFKLLKKFGYDLSLFDEVSGKNFFNAGYSLCGGFVKLFYNSPNLPKQKGSSDLHDYIFTGVGCSDLAEKIGGKWLDLFKYLKDFGVNFRRIDIALDDFNNPALIDFPRIERKLQRKEFRSSKRQYNILRDVSTSGELAGESVYLGSRGGSNHSLLRIYQKYLQMVGKHEESQMPLEALKSGSWIRWELEITKDKANAMINLILRNQSISKSYYSILRDVVEFVNPIKTKSGQVQKNKARWPVCRWWLDFLHGVEKAKLQDPEKTFDLGSALDWVRFSVVPTLQMLAEIYDSKMGVDFYSVLAGLDPMEYSKKQKRLILESGYISKKELQIYLDYFVKGPKQNDV